MSARLSHEQLRSLWVEITDDPLSLPPTNRNVIACGGGGQRFMKVDRNGQWRNMMNAPRPAPRYWMPMLPNPEDIN